MKPWELHPQVNQPEVVIQNRVENRCPECVALSGRSRLLCQLTRAFARGPRTSPGRHIAGLRPGPVARQSRRPRAIAQCRMTVNNVPGTLSGTLSKGSITCLALYRSACHALVVWGLGWVRSATAKGRLETVGTVMAITERNFRLSALAGTDSQAPTLSKTLFGIHFKEMRCCQVRFGRSAFCRSGSNWQAPSNVALGALRLGDTGEQGGRRNRNRQLLVAPLPRSCGGELRRRGAHTGADLKTFSPSPASA